VAAGRSAVAEDVSLMGAPICRKIGMARVGVKRAFSRIHRFRRAL